MICQFCGYEFDDACGKYGCPNCNGDGLEDSIMNDKLFGAAALFLFGAMFVIVLDIAWRLT